MPPNLSGYTVEEPKQGVGFTAQTSAIVVVRKSTREAK